MKKLKALFRLALIYLLAYGVGLLACLAVEPVVWKFFVFDSAATVVTFIFSVLLVNSSVYDAYWSLTPMVMSLWLFIRARAFAPFQLLFLLVFNLWSVRLTANWITVFTDFSYEDWRYRKYRAETPRLLWPVVNFFGIHYVPTLVVFLGMLPLFSIAADPLGAKALPGLLVMLTGIALEFFADRNMHAFLRSAVSGSVCHAGLWNYSRHPNYLGEISFWLGVYLAALPYAMDKWYTGIGFISVAVLFNVVSIPLMEHRQLARRPAYSDYVRTTSRLLLLPPRK